MESKTRHPITVEQSSTPAPLYVHSSSTSHVDTLLMEEVSAAVLMCLTRQLDMECRTMTSIEADTYMQHITSTYGTRSIEMAGKS
jgi:hypothetical protein